MDKDHMERTQIYLPVQLKKQFQGFAYEDDTNFSEVIRRAAQDYAEKRVRNQKKRKEAFLKALGKIGGIWKDRDDMDFEAIRKSSNRVFKGWND